MIARSLYRQLLLAALGLPLLVQAGSANAEDTAALAAEARGVVQQFSGALGKELKSALERGGPVAAIEVCNLKAPGIADQAGTVTGWHVGRTALKLRNPKNAADEWEKAVLQSFAQRTAAGEDLTRMEQTEIIARDGHRTVRYVKAIPTAELCVTCHGAALKPEVQTRLLELYPADQATGFAPGMLRGAFTLTKRLD